MVVYNQAVLEAMNRPVNPEFVNRELPPLDLDKQSWEMRWANSPVGLEVPPLPKEPKLSNYQNFATIGKTVTGYAGWGHFVSVEQLQKHYAEHGILTKEDAQRLDNLGFDGGHHLPPDFDPRNPKDQATQAPYVATLAWEGLQRREDWQENGRVKKIDVLVVASASAPEDIPQKTADYLQEEYGVKTEKAIFYGQACNGALGAITDLCQMEEMKGVRAVVVGAEWLSGEMVPHKKKQLMGTFGTGGGVTVFRPWIDIQHIMGQKVVEKDTEGIGVPKPPMYELPPPEERVDPGIALPWYTIVEGSEDHFAVDRYGNTYLKPIISEGKHADMQGWKVIKWFVPRTSNLMIDVLGHYRENYEEEHGQLENPVVSHQPSETVHSGVYNSFSKKRRRLAKKGIHIPDVEMPWKMKGTGMNNISAGTFSVQWTELVDEGRIELGKPTPWIGMGVWSVIEVGVVKFF